MADSTGIIYKMEQSNSCCERARDYLVAPMRLAPIGFTYRVPLCEGAWGVGLCARVRCGWMQKVGWARTGSRSMGGGVTVAALRSGGRPTRGEGRPPGLRRPGLTTRPPGDVHSLARAGPGPCDDITPSTGLPSRHGMSTPQGLLWPHLQRVAVPPRTIF